MPSTVTVMTPAELFSEGRIGTGLDLLILSLEEKTSCKQALQRSMSDGFRDPLEFTENDKVSVLNFNGKHQCNSQTSCKVNVDGVIMQQHLD